MAATWTLQAPRRKKLVYGKLSKPGYNAANFFDDEDELATSAHTVERKSTSTKPLTTQRTEAKAHILKPAREPTNPRDPFDIPSSEDEFETRVTVVTPPKYTPDLVNDRQGSDLVPWEKKNKLAAPPQQRDNTTQKNGTRDANPDAQLTGDLARATQSPEAKASSGSARQTVSPAQHSPSGAVAPANGNGELHPTSAAARLAARKRMAENNAPSSANDNSRRSDPIQKRISRVADSSEGTPRKRARTELKRKESDGSGDVAMAGVSSALAPQFTGNDGEMPTSNGTSIYDFPEIHEDEKPPSRPAMSPTKVGNRNARRGKFTTTRSMPRKGVSAPARLAEMIATDTDTSEAPTSSPSVSTSRRSTPNGPSTPQSVRNVSPGTPGRPITKVTPKQANLWSSLLPSDPVAPSPSTLPIKDLNISGSRRATATTTIRKLTKSQSAVGRRRTRLVDRLKASALESDGDSSDEDNTGDPSNLDTEMVEEASLPGPSKDVQAPTLPGQASYPQSRSQSTSANVTGPKITYSSMRTYLPEDDMEAELMLGLDSEPSQPPAATKRGISSQSQKSAFDFDESEDEGTGKMRSIHELRASGSNVRDMGDIEDLLDDIAKHNVTQRGTRRTALVNLATKLMDKSFRSRFMGQSCEARLAAECEGCPDAIADFLITSCIALLLDTEPPQHVLRSFQDCDIAGWLTKHLANDTAVSKLVKDRKHNMSKSAQVALQDMTEKLRLHTALWHENVPSTLSPRLVTLRASDLLVRALRRIGDRSDFLDGSQMQAILRDSYNVPNQAQQLDLAMSISVLESLSTGAMTLNWPADIIEKISLVLPQLDTGSTILRDTSFLALRLCLNLTNDNARNCDLLSKGNDGSTTSYLLRSIEQGFGKLGHEEDAEKKTVVLDLLLLAIGVMINLTDHSNEARMQATSNAELLDSLTSIFQFGQRHMLEAASEEESIANVTFGYLAVMLANLCQSEAGKAFIASKLPAQNLRMLVDAVEEFVAHHQKVDTMNFEGEEGREVWSGFTEKLKVVLGRLKEAESV